VLNHQNIIENTSSHCSYFAQCALFFNLLPCFVSHQVSFIPLQYGSISAVVALNSPTRLKGMFHIAHSCISH
jgi:hypothetical protein